MLKLRQSLSLFTKIRTAKDAIADKFTRLEKRVEGTRAENWLKYWKTVCKDYKDVALDIVKESREKPSKAILIGSTMSLITYFAKHNPDERHFRDTFIKASNEAGLCHEDLIRDDVKEHLTFIEKSYNNQVLRYMSFGVLSFIWVDNFSGNVKKFDSQCNYLQLGYFNRFYRVVDVGFLDTWWVLARKMTDFDINY